MKREFLNFQRPVSCPGRKFEKKIRDSSVFLTVGEHSQDGDFLGCSELLGTVFFLCPGLLKASKSEIPSESDQHVELIVV